MSLARKLLMGAAVGGGGGGGITLTPYGSLISGTFVGYDDGTVFGSGALGSISGQPKAGQTMTTLVSQPGGGASIISFLGNVTGLITGWTLTVAGTPYALTGADFSSGVYTSADIVGEVFSSFDPVTITVV